MFTWHWLRFFSVLNYLTNSFPNTRLSLLNVILTFNFTPNVLADIFQSMYRMFSNIMKFKWSIGYSSFHFYQYQFNGIELCVEEKLGSYMAIFFLNLLIEKTSEMLTLMALTSSIRSALVLAEWWSIPCLEIRINSVLCLRG